MREEQEVDEGLEECSSIGISDTSSQIEQPRRQNRSLMRFSTVADVLVTSLISATVG